MSHMTLKQYKTKLTKAIKTFGDDDVASHTTVEEEAAGFFATKLVMFSGTVNEAIRVAEKIWAEAGLPTPRLAGAKVCAPGEIELNVRIPVPKNKT